ncbi:hypothetical protein FRC08_009665 [Ceratobasidium sp. 394]|nr:hypothetical protein FRC08_009665 [Ceratobasidium sp. 394]
MTKAKKKGSTTAQWSNSSLAQILEMKPLLYDVFYPTAENAAREKLWKDFESRLAAGSASEDETARSLVEAWCQLAFTDTKAIFAKTSTAAIKQERHKLFFDVHRELLQSHPGKAGRHLNSTRKKIGLAAFTISDPNFKACIVAPTLPAKRTQATSSNAGRETRGDATHQPEASPFRKHTDESSVLPPDSEESFSTGQGATVTLDSTGPVGGSLEDEVRKAGAESKIHLGATSNEPEPSPPSTPSLADGVSSHSGISELGTPFTASLEIPKDTKASSKSTRRSGRGGTSRNHYTEKKTTPKRKSSLGITHLPAGNVDDVHGQSSEELEQQRKKPVKKAKKAKQDDQPQRIGGQSMRVALKESKAIQPKEDSPIEAATELAYSAVDQPSPGIENALQLTLEPQSSFQPEDRAETILGPMATGTEPEEAFQCLESPRPFLAYPSSPPVFNRSNSALPVPAFPPITPPRKTPLRSGVLPILSPISQASNVSPPTESHTLSSAFSVEMPGKSARAIEHQLEDVPLSSAARLALEHENNIRIPVWAVSRQELCELPYFKSMQGGVYARAHTVYGYLLGRFPSPRDAWRHDGRLIISHGGGKHMMNEDQVQLDDLTALAQSKHQLGDDQLETDASIRGLLTSYRMFRPIVILAEADYEHLQKFNLKRGLAKEANYYVLGHYAIVAAWAEREEINSQGVTSVYTRWKFAFQWIEQDQGPPWWLQATGTPLHVPEPPSMVREYESGGRESFDKIVTPRRFKPLEVVLNPFLSMGTEGKCGTCSAVSPKVYQREWVCLNPDCELFWVFSDEQAQQSEFQFDEGFLSLRELPVQLQRIPYSIIPEYPAWEHQANCSIFNRNFWAGVCCHRCGRVSCRQRWQIWECPTCKLTVEASRPQIYSSSTLDDPLSWETYGNGRFNPTEITASCRLVKYPGGESRVVVCYQLPSSTGQIVHVLNNPAASKVPNELFEQYQKDACDRDMFQRHAIKTVGFKIIYYGGNYLTLLQARSQRRAVCAAFYIQRRGTIQGDSSGGQQPSPIILMNGVQYIAEAMSTPFEECPDSVKNAVKHINYLCKGAVESVTEFNELLSVAYAEGQEMNFHSDDEPGLGSVVAGLTLGSSAEMMFRHNIAVKKNLIYKNGPYRASESRTVEAQNERILQITLSHVRIDDRARE